MAIERSTGVFVGTSESALQPIANNTTFQGNEVDLLGGANNCSGQIFLYVLLQSTVTTGTVDIRLNSRRVSGQAYSRIGPDISFAPTNGIQRIPIGWYPANRLMQVSVTNNSIGTNIDVFVGYELEKYS